jgi:hypothetical protein
MAKTEIICVILGVIITVLSIQMYTSDLFNAYYGYPFHWIHEYQPLFGEPTLEIVWFGLILDVVIWTVAFYILIQGLRILKKKGES